MSRRKLLWGVVAGLGLFGLVMLAHPFVRAMGTNARADNALWSMDVLTLQPGDFRYFSPVAVLPHGGNGLLVLRDYDSQLHVFTVPLSMDKVILPDRDWWRWYALCAEFGPDIEAGKLKKDGVIRCHDAAAGQWDYRPRMQWAYSGKSLHQPEPDMESPHYKVVGNRLMVAWREVW